jgi:hypothetical protein
LQNSCTVFRVIVSSCKDTLLQDDDDDDDEEEEEEDASTDGSTSAISIFV